MEPIRAQHRSFPLKGFTLVELLVVLAIMGIILSIVVTSQSTFNNTLVLSNTSYDVALAVRSVQNFGLGSRVADGVANTGYGIDFNSATPGKFVLFADTATTPGNECHSSPTDITGAPDAQTGDCIYVPGSGNDKLISSYTLGNGITVTELCVRKLISGSATWTCGLSSLDIVFARPDPAPYIRANGSSSTGYSQACLTLSTPQGISRFIAIYSSGQIDPNAPSDESSCHG